MGCQFDAECSECRRRRWWWWRHAEFARRITGYGRCADHTGHTGRQFAFRFIFTGSDAIHDIARQCRRTTISIVWRHDRWSTTCDSHTDQNTVPRLATGRTQCHVIECNEQCESIVAFIGHVIDVVIVRCTTALQRSHFFAKFIQHQQYDRIVAAFWHRCRRYASIDAQQSIVSRQCRALEFIVFTT